MAECANCGAQAAEGAAFCPACGTPVVADTVPPVAATIPFVASTVPPHWTSSSGQTPPSAPLQSPSPVQPSYSAQPPAKKKGGCLKWGLIAVGIIFVVGIIGNALGGDDKAVTPATTIASVAVDTGATVPQAPTTEAPATTEAPPTTEAPTTTEAPPATSSVQDEAAFKNASNPMSFKILNKNPDGQQGTSYTGTAQIMQIQETDGATFMLANVTKDDYDYWDDLVAFRYDSTTELVEGDVFRYWGICTGAFSYDTQIGGSNTVPMIQLRYVDKVSSGG